MNVVDLLKKAAAEGASDVFLIAGLPVTCRINGLLTQENEEKLLPKDTEELITQIYKLAENRSIEPLQKGGDDDFS